MVQMSSRQLNIDSDLDFKDMHKLFKVDVLQLTDPTSTGGLVTEVTTDGAQGLFLDGIQVFQRNGSDYQLPSNIVQQVGDALGMEQLSNVDANSAVEDDLLSKDNANNWANVTRADVVTSYMNSLFPGSGTFLKWNGSSYEFASVAAGASALGDLTDVDVSTLTPVDGHALIYNSSFIGTEWRNKQLTIQDLKWFGTVNEGAATTGDVLTWDGAKYVLLAAPGSTGVTGNLNLQSNFIYSDSAAGEPWLKFQDNAIQIGTGYTGSQTPSYSLTTNAPSADEQILISTTSGTDKVMAFTPFKDATTTALSSYTGLSSDRLLTYTGSEFAWLPGFEGVTISSPTEGGVFNRNKLHFIPSGTISSIDVSAPDADTANITITGQAFPFIPAVNLDTLIITGNTRTALVNQLGLSIDAFLQNGQNGTVFNATNITLDGKGAGVAFAASSIKTGIDLFDCRIGAVFTSCDVPIQINSGGVLGTRDASDYSGGILNVNNTLYFSDGSNWYEIAQGPFYGSSI